MRRSEPAAALAAAFIATSITSGIPGDALPRGRVVEKIACREAPSLSYALYLPSAYTPDRRWPVLYLLDARGRALVPLERFREAAEAHGWILVSSHDSRSDTKDDPNRPAIQAMWRDTHERLAIDDRRITLTGFSGTARAAVNLAVHAPKAIAGVIGCGAGVADERVPLEGLSFAYFGTVGNRDFNYYEMRDLDRKLAAAKVPHRIEVFDGGHEWPPAPLAEDAIAWMDIEAMKRGALARDDARIEALLHRDMERARALEASGNAAGASIAYANVADDYRGLADVTAAADRAATLAAEPAVRKALAQAHARDERNSRSIESLNQKLEAAARAPDLPLARTVAAELGIASLRKQAASSADPEDRLAAQRTLATLRARASFYLPEQLIEEGRYDRAYMILNVAVEIDPDDPRGYYNLAGAEAKAGESRRALKDLQRALDRGFRHFEYFDEDEDFAKLRADPEFQNWLAAARAGAAPAPSPTPSP